MKSTSFWTPQVERTALCFGVALLTYWCIAGSLVYYWPEAQAALIVGVTAGLIGSVWSAAACSGSAMVLGLLLGPHNMWRSSLPPEIPLLVAWVLLAATVAAVVALIVSRRLVAPRWLFWGVVALMVVNLWMTAATLDMMPRFNPSTGGPRPSVQAAIGGEPGSALNIDEYLYEWLLRSMKDGSGYYSAFSAARPAVVPGAVAPSSILNVREPTLYLALAAAPNPWIVIGAQLLLVTGAALGVTALVRDVVKLPLALPGVAAVLAIGVFLSSQVPLYAEAWAGPLALIALALVAASGRQARWRPLVVCAAAAALLAFLVRELAVFVVLAGLAGAWFAPAEQRSFRMKVWAGALALAVAGFAAHWWLAAPHLVGPTTAAVGAEGFAFLGGGPSFALSALVYGASEMFVVTYTAGLVPWLLAALGLIGAFLLPRPETRIMAVGTVFGILLTSLVAGNGAHDSLTGASRNYWGATSAFVMYGCVPVAFSLLRAARSSAPIPRRRLKKK